ncbi:hypothetical protein RRG08_005635 [Elysia crispata]|uniref:Uncharacterized protein n=1 Tax=Elysia crispata TaxID=231223 RepID=A0AAE0YY16_9GAST|nr:hypothetical protein RRG08_005635 [Elysia crispata]
MLPDVPLVLCSLLELEELKLGDNYKLQVHPDGSFQVETLLGLSILTFKFIRKCFSTITPWTNTHSQIIPPLSQSKLLTSTAPEQITGLGGQTISHCNQQHR